MQHAVNCLHNFISRAPGNSIDGTALASFYNEYPECKTIVRSIKAKGVCELPYAKGKLAWINDSSSPGKGRMVAIVDKV